MSATATASVTAPVTARVTASRTLAARVGAPARVPAASPQDPAEREAFLDLAARAGLVPGPNAPRRKPRAAARPAHRAVEVAPAPAGLRLTARGRTLVVLVLAALLLTAFSLGRAGSSASTDAGAPVAAPVAVTVQAGDTLWAIAQRHAPDHDPREVVAVIRELNGLAGVQVQAGQQLLLPVVR